MTSSDHVLIHVVNDDAVRLPIETVKNRFFRGIFVKLKILHENVSSLLRPGSEAEY